VVRRIKRPGRDKPHRRQLQLNQCMYVRMSSTGVTSSIRAASVRLSQIYSQSKEFGNARSRIDLMYIACMHEHRRVRRHTPVFLPRPRPTRRRRKKAKVELSLGRENSVLERVNRVHGMSPTHLTDPVLLTPSRSMYSVCFLLFFFSNTRPSVTQMMAVVSRTNIRSMLSAFARKIALT
jgi:hypothetical protein